MADNLSMAMFYSIMEEGLANAKSRILEGSYVPDFNIPPQKMNQTQERNQGFIDITSPYPFGVHDIYNAYFDIIVSMNVIITEGAQAIPADTFVVVGFKNALYIIDRFVWKVSGTDVQTEIN